MLALVAAQLNFKADNNLLQRGKAVWVDVSCPFVTGRDAAKSSDWRRHGVSQNTSAISYATPFDHEHRYNIEAMAAFLPVTSFFSHIYLVDLSPSLCEVARQRFQRLGWKNVSVICQDARSFRLPDDEGDSRNMAKPSTDAITMSYSLSMIPGQH